MAAAGKVGLALSGGGALGAYQVGVVKAYVELGGGVDVLAGSSVGALNGAVLASAPSLEEGVERLEQIWLENPMLRVQLAMAKNVGVAEWLLHALVSLGYDIDTGAVSPRHLEKLVDTYLDFERLAAGPPFFVSVYESHGAFRDLSRLALAESGVLDTPPSKFLHLQSHPPGEQREILFASAAIPVIFPARKAGGGIRLADGGLGGFQKHQGITPVEPLQKASCDTVLVSHLSDGSLWSRDDYPSLTVVEIRPRSTIRRGLLLDLFEHDPKVLKKWMDTGYTDARSQLERTLRLVKKRYELDKSVQAISDREALVEEAETRRKKAMSRLPNPSDPN